jgi:hypothetical protein
MLKPGTFKALAERWRQEASRSYEIEFAKELELLIQAWDFWADNCLESEYHLLNLQQDLLGTKG